jgi:hypothetical protein
MGVSFVILEWAYYITALPNMFIVEFHNVNMAAPRDSWLITILQALLVTFLWSTSWVLVKFAILAWVFLGEQPGPKEWMGMGIATLGVIMVNLRGIKYKIP